MLRPQTEALRKILFEPLDYLHPHRATIPAVFEGKQARMIVNQALLRGFKFGKCDNQQTVLGPWAERWVVHWSRLTTVAYLMGVQLAGTQLAVGGRLCMLEPFARTFLRVNLRGHTQVILADEDDLETSLTALGLSALLSWKLHIPEALIERLPLLFAPRVVTLQKSLPPQTLNSSLFLLAVQHARINQIPY